MSEATPKNIVRTALLATWGMITLVLVCVVGMLIYKMYQQDQSTVLSSETQVSISPSGTSTLVPSSTTLTEVPLYFASSTKTELPCRVKCAHCRADQFISLAYLSTQN
jgi:hypothetical protein